MKNGESFNLQVVIKKCESKKIIEKSFNKIHGSSFQSNKEAANQSLKKISEKITEDFLPEIIDLIKGK